MSTRPVAAVTGASGGIGAVFARKLAARGYDLLLIARRKDRLDDTAATLARDYRIDARTLAADLASAGGLSAAADLLAGESRLELLVNNAGFGTKGVFWKAAFDEQERMHRLHVDAVLRLTRAALTGMVKRNRGAVINVSSVAAFLRSPANVSYCATKAWMNAFTEGVYLDLKVVGSAVKVQALCPGFTYSEFHDVMGVERSSIPRWLWMSADSVVDASLNGLESGKLFVVPGWPYRLAVMLMMRLPARLRLSLEAASPHSRNRLR
jgi:uncharacterized protein